MINICEKGLTHTIKANFYKTSLANLIRAGSFGATGIIEKTKEETAGDKMAEIKVNQLGNFSESKRDNPNTNRVYDKGGLSPALNTMQGGNRQPMVIDDIYSNRQPRSYEDCAPSLRSERSGLKTVEDVVINDRGFREKSPQVSVGVVPTLRTETHGNLPKICDRRYRIRKLTPRECWRLMGFSDSDFEKAAEVNSNTQLYKEAGNSIVKDVLMAIFRQMID